MAEFLKGNCFWLTSFTCFFEKLTCFFKYLPFVFGRLWDWLHCYRLWWVSDRLCGSRSRPWLFKYYCYTVDWGIYEHRMRINTTAKHNTVLSVFFLSEDATCMDQNAVATVILTYIGGRRGSYQHGQCQLYMLRSAERWQNPHESGQENLHHQSIFIDQIYKKSLKGKGLTFLDIYSMKLGMRSSTKDEVKGSFVSMLMSQSIPLTNSQKLLTAEQAKKKVLENAQKEEFQDILCSRSHMSNDIQQSSSFGRQKGERMVDSAEMLTVQTDQFSSSPRTFEILRHHVAQHHWYEIIMINQQQYQQTDRQQHGG